MENRHGIMVSFGNNKKNAKNLTFYIEFAIIIREVIWGASYS